MTTTTIRSTKHLLHNSKAKLLSKVLPAGFHDLFAPARHIAIQPAPAIPTLKADWKQSRWPVPQRSFHIALENARIGSCIAVIGFYEIAPVAQENRMNMPHILQTLRLIQLSEHKIHLVSTDEQGHIWLLFSHADMNQAKAYLAELARAIAAYHYDQYGATSRLTPMIGLTHGQVGLSVDEEMEQAWIAMGQSEIQLDNDPKIFRQDMLIAAKSQSWIHSPLWLQASALDRFWRNHGTGIWQSLLTFGLGWGIPLSIYLWLGWSGFVLIQAIYLFVVLALLLTALLIWYEGFLALKRDKLPEVRQPYPPASMIIPAYLPNEINTVEDTIEACLKIDYPADLQIILAYNTPYDLPIESKLQAMAEQYPQLTVLKVNQSHSKAQNVNNALSRVTGEFVGIFDADHWPNSDSFRRAWAWLSNGYDIVQGHCLIRNGDINNVTSTVAVEFEAIYAVSHPGRARLHQFGIFGGSNGYWRTELLSEMRMQGFMLTEDIDSSMRTLREGYKIKSDPQLISRELAPTSLSALWEQRMRWAQGWTQVARRHGFQSLGSSELNLHQKLGIFHLLIWREIYPWIAMQIIPIIIYWAVMLGGLNRIDWLIPIFVVTSIVTLGAGFGTVFYTQRMGDPSIVRRPTWILRYLLLSFFYAEWKNTIARVAQIKELLGEHKWMTTPRK